MKNPFGLRRIIKELNADKQRHQEYCNEHLPEETVNQEIKVILRKEQNETSYTFFHTYDFVHNKTGERIDLCCHNHVFLWLKTKKRSTYPDYARKFPLGYGISEAWPRVGEYDWSLTRKNAESKLEQEVERLREFLTKHTGMKTELFCYD